MVRFKDINKFQAIIVIYFVSIPKWYDLKIAYLPAFNARLTSFNSKMVRFKEVHHLSLLFLFGVSIPKWYDLKKARNLTFCLSVMSFQFQNGTI